MDSIFKRILELKKEIQTPKVKLAIQKLQQSLYESKSKSKISASEKRDKNNSAKNSSIKDEDIEAFLFNRYNR
jgi:NACalpha-BTF3-like transcription factor